MSDSPHPGEAIAVRDNQEAHRFEVIQNGQLARLDYQRQPDAIALVHTEVPEALRGSGLAPALAKFALETARRENLRVIPICPYVQAYLKKHPEYQSLVR